MVPVRHVGTLLVPVVIGLCAGAVSGQDYPNKTIRFVTGSSGGGTDFSARLIAQGLTASLGQPLVVENRPGVTPMELVAKAPPDGYTILLNGNIIWYDPLLRGNSSYDPLRDFAPITLAASSPQILVVHPSLPAKSVKDLIALGKARPGEINYSATTPSSPPHLAGELFKSMAGVNFVSIPYKGTAPGVNAVISGEAQIVFPNAAVVTPHIKSGRLRALAVTSAQPSALLPGLPTVAASLPGYEAGTLYVMFAPAKTPEAIINRLNQEIVRVLGGADLREKFFNAGVEAVGSSPAQLAATMKADMTRMGKVIRDAGIKAD